MKRRALRRTAGPGTAAAAGTAGGHPASHREVEPAGGRPGSEPLGREMGKPRGAGAQGMSSVPRADDVGAAGRLGPSSARLPRLPACPASAFAFAFACAGGGPRP